jgi:serralysin
MYGSMAAGSPLSDAWDWASGKVGDLYDTVYNWVSDNVSRSPIGIFSTLASVAPYAMSGVRFNVPAGIDSDVLGILSGSQWNSTAITYSLPDSRLDYQWVNPSANGYRALSFETEQAVRYALEGYSPYSGGPKMGLSSVEGVTNLSLSYAGRGGGTLQIAGFNPTDIINRSHGYYPGVPVYGGDVWLERNSGLPGTYSYMLVLHELGHALGLKHPHDSGGALPTMSSEHDSPEYTVMSYGDTWDDPQTYMQYDIAALQELYGADFTTNGGNTVYTWSAQTGEAFLNGVRQGAPVTNKIFMTIWDGGGNDTYDLSNYSDNQVIDLAPGGYIKFSQTQLGMKTSTTYVHGNVYNALQYRGDRRSLIENATGGSGHDSIKGNVADNVLNGGAGNDGLTGAAGNDTLIGGAGNDWLDGGTGADLMNGEDGWDVASYMSATSGVTVDMTTNANGGAAAGDRILNVEVLQGTNHNDRLTGVDFGGGHGVQLYGEGGDDTLTGHGGGDYLFGGAGNDTLDSGFGGDVLNGGIGADIFRFSTALGAGNVDTVQDFSAAEGDRIVLSRHVFMDVGTGALSSAYFKVGAATSFDHHILYHQGTGELFYDVDGSGGVAAIKFAALTAGTALSAANFLVM